MLGTRTKQVYSYGKRNQRIINVSEGGDRLKKPIPNIFDELEPAPQWAPIASKMRKRENAIPAKLKTPSPKIVRVNRKKRLSPILSQAKKRTRAAQIIQAETSTYNSHMVKQKSLASETKVKTELSPPRMPLAFFSPNAPGSPAVLGKPRGTRVSPAKRTPFRLNKPFLPFVDVDIIVLDDDGRTVKKERRVSRTDVDANPQVEPTSYKLPKARKKNILAVESDSEAEIIAPKPSKRSTRRKPIIYSDDSGSDDELPVQLPSPSHTRKPLSTSQPTLGHLTKTGSSRMVVEVIVPPAQYPIKKTPLPSLPSETAQPILQSPVIPYDPPVRYQRISSPMIRARQLTPIRGSRGKHMFAPPSPPSPFTGTDLDLSFDFAELTLATPSTRDTSSHLEPEVPIPEYLLPLLQECHQETQGLIDFSSFIETFPFDPVVRSDDVLPSQSTFRKIGEASYSEVFGIGGVVLKVIPLRDESTGNTTHSNSNSKPNTSYNEDQNKIDGPAPSDAKDVRKEMIVTRAMGQVCDGFVELLKTYIVRGKYPEVLLRLWDEYHEQKGSESVRPDTFLVSQVYAIIVLPNGGPDLEAYNFVNSSKMGWRQAASLFWQVTKTLAHAEQLVSFEHRDLHWGQILVKNLPIRTGAPLKTLNQNQKSTPKSRFFMDDQAHGVQATLIDLGLARMDAGDGAGGEKVHWTPFEDEVFMGEGDYQFDVYRMMKEYNGGAWEDFNPITNVMWLHYLVLKLLHSKRLKPPIKSRKARTSDVPPIKMAAFTEKDCYDCLVDIEAWLGQCIAALNPEKPKPTSKNKGRKKTQAPLPVKLAPSIGPVCAGEIVAYAAKKGWIKPPS